MKRDNLVAYLFVIPFILISTAFGWVPIAFSFWYSLQSYILSLPFETHFIGFQNYVSLLESSAFLTTVLHSFYVVVLAVPLEVGGGILVALLLNRRLKGRGILRSIMILPWTLPPVVAALAWTGIYNPDFGALNGFLVQLGIISPTALPVWLSGSTALPAVVVVHVWRMMPFAAMLILANLQIISGNLYEAAESDGAGIFDRFRTITLPLLRPALLIVGLWLMIQAFQLFDEMYILTYQNPTTETLMMNVYFTNFTSFDFGLGSAMSYILILVTTIIGIAYFRRRGVA